MAIAPQQYNVGGIFFPRPFMEQVGWDGRPRPQSQRRQVSGTWPEALEPLSDTFVDQVYQGPLG